MESLIRDIIELDKKKRLELEALEQEKSKIGAFLREKRKEIQIKYQKQADEIYKEKKSELDQAISSAEEDAKKKYEIAMKEIEMVFDKHHDNWVEDLYEYCINFDVKDE